MLELLGAVITSLVGPLVVALMVWWLQRRTSTKLDVIHVLVNQKMTDVTQKALDAYELLLDHLLAQAGAPNAAQLFEIADVRREIEELRETLLGRAIQQEKVNAPKGV